MSAEIPFGQEDLEPLPRWAKVAIAAYFARLSLPVFETWAKSMTVTTPLAKEVEEMVVFVENVAKCGLIDDLNHCHELVKDAGKIIDTCDTLGEESCRLPAQSATNAIHYALMAAAAAADSSDDLDEAELNEYTFLAFSYSPAGSEDEIKQFVATLMKRA